MPSNRSMRRGPTALALALALLLAALAAVSLPGPAASADTVAPPEVPEAVDGRLERILQRGRLIVGVKTDYAPWGMVAADGSITGMEAELAAEVAQALEVDLDLVSVTTANRLQRLEDGVVDLVIATLGDTPERREISDLIRPHYYASGVNLLARRTSPFQSWGELRGRPVCLTGGAYYNRALAERYLIDPVVFPGTRDTALALRDGRCVGWAYDDTVLARMLSDGDWSDYHMALPTIMSTPWALAVRKGEGDAAFGRFVADMVAYWHRSGRLVEAQADWGLPPHAFLDRQHALWRERGADGGFLCERGADGAYPAECLDEEVARLGGADAGLSGWAVGLRTATGLDLTPVFDGFDRARLVKGLWLTLALSLAAIAGSLAVGVLFAWSDRALRHSLAGRLLRLPIRAAVAVARMTPPILQLYVVFFGLGGLLASGYGITLSGFLVATVVFSFYAGATNAALLGAALKQLERERPEAGGGGLIPAAIERSYEGLVATSVNIVKAAGMASTIAVPEIVSVTNTIIAERGNAATMMNLLLVFYFLFVFAVLGLLRTARGLVVRWTRSA